jgi:hypothetical protein
MNTKLFGALIVLMTVSTIAIYMQNGKKELTLPEIYA